MSGRNRLPVVLLTAFAVGVLAAPAAGARKCPQRQILPEVSLTTNLGRIAYNNRKSRRQLGALQGHQGSYSPTRTNNSKWHAIGLTQTELKFRMKISVNTLAVPGRGHCANVAAVEAELGYGTINVYVDKRYRKGSCQYLSVLEHENEHVAIFRDALAIYTPKVERRLSNAAAELKTITASTPDRAATRLQKQLQRKMKPLFKEMNAVMDRKNASIDTAKNYRREQARCSSW